MKASETRLTYQGRVGFCVPYKLVEPTQYDGELERHLRRAVWLVSTDRPATGSLVAGQGRHDAQTVDALALGADEGRGNAAKRSGEPRAGCEPDISEWGNPSS